jgi:ribosome recycling factor
MAAEQAFKDMEAAMTKAIDALRVKLSHLRTGRASPALLEPVRVDAYGQQMPLNQVATVTVPEPRMIMVAPFDKSQIPAIEKAIQSAGLGLNPMSQGNVIRVPIPALTEERRKDLAKQVKAMGEDVKVSIRNSRRDANEAIKKSEASKDEAKAMQDRVQKKTDEMIAKVDDAVKKKEAEVMEV